MVSGLGSGYGVLAIYERFDLQFRICVVSATGCSTLDFLDPQKRL